ncbi:Serine/threonine-protein kinase HT1 [Cucurbita argyrosperma subsp. argyrosperma]|nr:Serine/threonine-protein kinase HT1 [Cucurbita argyrosperma subsp. argyrosperma]
MVFCCCNDIDMAPMVPETPSFCVSPESLRLASFPAATHPPLNSVAQSRSHVLNKQRSLSPAPSPSPQTTLSDAFKSARTDQKRFSTPPPQRKAPGKEKGRRLFSKKAKERNSLKEEKLKGLLRHFASFKGNGKSKFKESSWTRFFEHNGGKVTAVEAVDESSIDLSKLSFGHKFAFGAHSRLYHGLYEDNVVAAKMINLPVDDENGELAGRLKKQFDREVTLLSRLRHPNVIKVDMYSFGLILWELVAGKIPYEDMTPIQAAFAVVDKNIRPAIPSECPPVMQALMEQCWSTQPEERPEFWQVVKVLEQLESCV